MNKTEHLLACLAEEAGEIVQAVGKAQRFGLYGYHPELMAAENVRQLCVEIGDLLGVVDMVRHWPGWDNTLLEKARREKPDKVRRYMQVAIEAGTLDPDPGKEEL